MCRCCAVNSVGSSVCSRYDPDVLRQEVAVRKQHVEQLRRELRHMKTEMQHTQDGVHALSMYDVICFTHIIHHVFTLVHFVFTLVLCVMLFTGKSLVRLWSIFYEKPWF